MEIKIAGQQSLKPKLSFQVPLSDDQKKATGLFEPEQREFIYGEIGKQTQNQVEGPKKNTVEKQIEHLEPYWRFGGRLAGERSESSHAGATESEHITESSNLYVTDSQLSGATNSLKFQMASLSGKAIKNNVVIEQTASNGDQTLKTGTPPSN